MPFNTSPRAQLAYLSSPHAKATRLLTIGVSDTELRIRYHASAHPENRLVSDPYPENVIIQLINYFTTKERG